MSIEWNPAAMDRRSTFVPQHLRGGLSRYVEQGIRPGDGLLSILEDRPLSQVLARVDAETAAALLEIYRFLYNNVGSPAWGSPERVKDWIAQGGIQGR